ncbi:MAG: filamentous hemagglutinin N-terminal domain-containing protein [Candidatus Symbiobacter sp.]|nr:filamentous hemagglutinin N-terminal domain-containing protein [Candidatus Symbiobacter sp.]
MSKFILNLTNPPRNKHHQPIARKLLTSTALAVVMAAAGVMSHPVLAAPTGGVVSQGAGQIATEGVTTNVTQTSQRAVINWQKFDLTPDEKVQFTVPDNGATLNRINEQTGPTHILGTITSNGTLYFVNQNGFVFGPQSNVTAKNLVVTTQNIASTQFMTNPSEGVQTFIPPEIAAAKITLQGKIQAADHGVVAIFGPNIEAAQNSAIIANAGSVIVAASTVNKLDLSLAGLARFDLGSHNFPHMVRNDGIIAAAGGVITLLADAPDHSNRALVENNGSLDTSNGDNKGGTIALIAQNGAVHLNGELVIPGKNGTLILHEDSPNADIIIDNKFLKKIHFAPGVNLDLASGYGLIVKSDLKGGAETNLTLKAAVGIVVTGELEAGSITASGLFFKTDHAVTVGAGGLTITTTGENWSYKGRNSAGIVVNLGQDHSKIALLTQNGGDIRLTATDGHIFINNAITTHNLTVTGGGINLNGDVTADVITIHGLQTGNVWLGADIRANRINAIADGGAIDFYGNLYLLNPDQKNPNLNAEVTAGKKPITFHEDIFVTYVRVANDQGDIYFNKAITGDDGVKLPYKIEVRGHGTTHFLEDVAVRAGGYFDLNVGAWKFTHVKANDANISIVLTDPGFFYAREESTWRSNYVQNHSKTCYAYWDCSKMNVAYGFLIPITAGVGGPRDNVSLDLDKSIEFDHAQSAYFNVPAGIDIYTHVTAKNFTVSSLHNRFVYNSTIEPVEGGIITIIERRNFTSLHEANGFSFTKDLTDRFVGGALAKYNLNIITYGDLTINTPLVAGDNRDVTLAGRNIYFNQPVTMNGGKLSLIYNRQAGDLDFTAKDRTYYEIDRKAVRGVFDNKILNDQAINFNGDANIEIVSYGDLTVRGKNLNFTNAEIRVKNQGSLSIDGTITVEQHLTLFSDQDIWINQPVISRAGKSNISILSKDDNEYLHFGLYGKLDGVR